MKWRSFFILENTMLGEEFVTMKQDDSYITDRFKTAETWYEINSIWYVSCGFFARAWNFFRIYWKIVLDFSRTQRLKISVIWSSVSDVFKHSRYFQIFDKQKYQNVFTKNCNKPFKILWNIKIIIEKSVIIYQNYDNSSFFCAKTLNHEFL